MPFLNKTYDDVDHECKLPHIYINTVFDRVRELSVGTRWQCRKCKKIWVVCAGRRATLSGCMPKYWEIEGADNAFSG